MSKSTVEDNMDAANDANDNNDTSTNDNVAMQQEKSDGGAKADDTAMEDAPMENNDQGDISNDTDETKVEDTNVANEDDENDAKIDNNVSKKEDDAKSDKDEQQESNNESKKRPAPDADATITKAISNDDKNDEPLPTLPLKKARTAYFIFAQDKREELKQKYQGEGVAAISKATGELWKGLQPAEKEVYESQAAKEREKYMKDKKRLIDAGAWPESNSGGADGGEYDEDAIIFPIGRIRKICKLDSDVKGMSKEATLLVAKATELFASKLGSEVVTMAQMSNRRKLLPDDVVEVCSVKERFMFLKDDLRDLVVEQKEIQKEKENEKATSGKNAKSGGDGKQTSSLLSYFGKVNND